MTYIIAKIKSISKIQIFALVLIIIGLAIMIPKGRGMLDFYKEVQYAREHDVKAGNLSPDLLRPWMSVRYISVAYAVPQKYLFDAAAIHPKKENSMIALNRLNGQMGLGTLNGRPVLMNIIRDAIIKYRANPVATGLLEKNVTDWMSVQYIANSTGIPPKPFFRIWVSRWMGNAYLPLGGLSTDFNYVGGSRKLVADIQKIVDSHAVQP